MNDSILIALETYGLMGAEGEGSEAEMNTDMNELITVCAKTQYQGMRQRGNCSTVPNDWYEECMGVLDTIRSPACGTERPLTKLLL